jgi:hypothetical protein
LLAKAPKIDFDLTATREVNVAAVSGNQKYRRGTEPEVSRRISHRSVAHGRSDRANAPQSGKGCLLAAARHVLIALQGRKWKSWSFL